MILLRAGASLTDPLPDHVARSVDGAGGDRVHADVVLGGLQCRCLGKRDHCPLGRCIKAVARYTCEATRHRRLVDDRPAAVLHHLAQLV